MESSFERGFCVRLGHWQANNVQIPFSAKKLSETPPKLPESSLHRDSNAWWRISHNTVGTFNYLFVSAQGLLLFFVDQVFQGHQT